MSLVCSLYNHLSAAKFLAINTYLRITVRYFFFLILLTFLRKHSVLTSFLSFFLHVRHAPQPCIIGDMLHRCP